MSTTNLPGVKGDRRVRLTSSSPSVSRLSRLSTGTALVFYLLLLLLIVPSVCSTDDLKTRDCCSLCALKQTQSAVSTRSESPNNITHHNFKWNWKQRQRCYSCPLTNPSRSSEKIYIRSMPVTSILRSSVFVGWDGLHFVGFTVIHSSVRFIKDTFLLLALYSIEWDVRRVIIGLWKGYHVWLHATTLPFA
jgi:hypothetical protein